ncbi:hypothetical protein TSUD_322730 [Trifolium subterraneum]|uniref:Uncharacterized protein n=1 Tax=Trifolium subterraneum TaxID=3900 RepID=A0A2Z6MMJ2_TRISU|nr:hypothetical protein TSUD_322730 [Trifolium subterraneum]
MNGDSEKQKSSPGEPSPEPAKHLQQNNNNNTNKTNIATTDLSPPPRMKRKPGITQKFGAIYCQHNTNRRKNEARETTMRRL